MSEVQKINILIIKQLQNTHITIEEYDISGEFTNNCRNFYNNKPQQSQQNPQTLKQNTALSMQMIDENSNTIPFFQKRPCMKSSMECSNDQSFFQNKPFSNVARLNFEEIATLQPSQIQFSTKQNSCEDYQMVKQCSKYSCQNQQIQANLLNHRSNDLSPIDMTQYQISTQSSSPDYDLAIIQNPQISQQNININNKISSFVGCGQQYNIQSSSQVYLNSNNINSDFSSRNIIKKQQSKIQSFSSNHDINSLSTRNTSVSTNGSTGLNQNKMHDYTFEGETGDLRVPCDDMMNETEGQQVEDFSLYVKEYEKKQVQKQNMQYETVQQEEIYQERLFGDNPNYVPKYAYQIVQNLFKSQKNYRIRPVTEPRELLLRENLIDIMSQFHSRLKLQNETFYLSVNIFARYLDECKQSLSYKKQIILVTTSLFVAAKYQEIYPPSLRDFQTLLLPMNMETSQQEILECEGSILNKLNFSLFGPTRLQFLEAYLSQTTLDSAQKCFCYYLLELTNLNHSFFQYDHSKIAASTIFLSEKFKNISGNYFWSENLEILTNYKQQDVYNCVENIYTYLVNVGNSERVLNIQNKYSDPLYRSVAKINYDLTNNTNNHISQQNTQETQILQLQNSQQHCYSQQPQQSQQNYIQKQMNQSQQLNQSIQQNYANMTQSTNLSYSSNTSNCENQQYYPQQFLSNQQGFISKAKSDCYGQEYDENTQIHNYMSEARTIPKNNKQTDILRYLKKL